jgi:hypothetical protein
MDKILGLQETNLDNCKIVSCELTKEQHKKAVEIIEHNYFWESQYDLEEVEDKEMVNVWIADAHAEGREEYAEFLRKALAEDAYIYTMVERLGDAKQPLGEVTIYFD